MGNGKQIKISLLTSSLVEHLDLPTKVMTMYLEIPLQWQHHMVGDAVPTLGSGCSSSAGRVPQLHF